MHNRFLNYFFCLLLASAMTPVDVFAGEAEDFLQMLDGKFRGRGKVVFQNMTGEQPVSCRIENSYDEAQKVLSVTGNCASTQGKTVVKGQLEIVEGKIAGSFISPNAKSEITQSNGEIRGDELIVSTSFVNNDSGNLSRIRQIVVLPTEDGTGFMSKFQSYDNASKEYQDTGWVEFSSSKK